MEARRDPVRFIQGADVTEESLVRPTMFTNTKVGAEDLAGFEEFLPVEWIEHEACM